MYHILNPFKFNCYNLVLVSTLALGHDDSNDLEKPRRIVLEGVDPLGSIKAKDEKLIIDLHLQLETYDSLEKLVEVV